MYQSDCLLQNAPLMVVADAAALPTNSPSDIAAQLRKCPTGLQEEQLLQLSSRALACGYCLTAALAMEQLRGQMQQAEAWQWARQCSGAATSGEPCFKSLRVLAAACISFVSHELGRCATTECLGFRDTAADRCCRTPYSAPCAVGGLGA